MIGVLPGQPQSRLQGVTCGCWDGYNYIVYISGSAFTILNDASRILQTVYDDDDETYLQAVAFDEGSGKIATCTASQVRVYKPLELQRENMKWGLQFDFEIPDVASETPCVLSWGGLQELLVASQSISLFATLNSPISRWRKALPSAVKAAAISYDSAYVASVCQHDCLPMVWRRLIYGADEVRFDFTYLHHPEVVTSVRWRKPFHLEQTSANILYTFCLDYVVRIWMPKEATEGRHWQLWGRVDLNDISPQGPALAQPLLAFIIDGRDFTGAVESAVQGRMKDDQSTDDAALDHLVAIANKSPEICMSIDKSGLMSAWALENVGGDDSDSSNVFSIAQVHIPMSDTITSFLDSQDDGHVEVHSYCQKSCGKLILLLHSFDGRIGVFGSNVADLLDLINNDRRMALESIWSGHSAAVQKIVRNFSGQAVVSRTSKGECILWKTGADDGDRNSCMLVRCSKIPEPQTIHRIIVLRKGRFVVLLCERSISLWDCRRERAALLGRAGFDLGSSPLCLVILPRPNADDASVAHVATVSADGNGIVWQINLPSYLNDIPGNTAGNIENFCEFELQTGGKMKYMLPVDPAGALPVATGFLDVFARDIAISYTHDGVVTFWTARVNLKSRSVDWLSTSRTETNLTEPAMASGSMLKKAALVNQTRSQITIWDIGGSRLEYEKDHEAHHVIQDLDWTSTPDAQAILAVGFQHRVVLLSQMRFDYLNKGPAWAPIHEIDIRDLTSHPIGDSVWLTGGHLLIGAGNQLFIHDRSLSSSQPIRSLKSDVTQDLFEAVQRFNGPLPVFHPQFLSQCILCGKLTLVRLVLSALDKTLRYLVEGETVDDYLGLELAHFYAADLAQHVARVNNRSSFLGEDDSEDATFSEKMAASINEKLTKLRISQLSRHEQIQLADMIECVALGERHRRSLDENGSRFMLFFRQNALRKGRATEMQLSWREINWAFHSNSQDLLLDFVSRQNHGKILWEQARECGLFMWLSDSSTLRTQFEAIARSEYAKSETKDPVDCSLFYLALRKKTVLQGLWRMASWNKEQTATQKLLSNNFDDPRWKTAALKNAYALLSKRRFQYAAALFLLADHLEAAVDVCIRQIKDLQLAVAIARVYEGDDGHVLKKLIREDVLGIAAQEGNRWLASWAFWMLGRKDMAVRALIMPVYTLIETPHSPDIKSRLFLTDDPALVVLYSQLREKTLQTLRGASKVTPKIEWEFVLHSAKLYDRMGCDLLGLDLVRNWEFQQSVAPGFGGEVNPLKLLRRRSSLVVDDLSSIRRNLGLQIPGEAPSRPSALSTFQEPDASSLLDSFGL